MTPPIFASIVAALFFALSTTAPTSIETAQHATETPSLSSPEPSEQQVTVSSNSCPAGVSAVLFNPAPFEIYAASAAIARAASFMASNNACKGDPISFFVRFHPVVTSGQGRSVIGKFDSSDNTVHMTSPSPAVFERPYLGLPMTPGIYSSVISHEMIHAMSATMYSYEPGLSTQDEYVAYAGQLWGMEPFERDAILKASSVQPSTWADTDFVNDLVLSVAPGKFAASAWLHYSSSDGGPAFLHDIWTGKWRPSWILM